MFGFLVHQHGDDVGVAIKDLKKGEIVKGKTFDGKQIYEIEVKEDIPYGHKIALRDIEVNEKVMEYGEIIGKAIEKIVRGSHVHVHNIKSLRWG